MLSFRTATSRSQLLNTQITGVTPQWLTGFLSPPYQGWATSASPTCLLPPLCVRCYPPQQASGLGPHGLSCIHLSTPCFFVGSQSELVSPVKTDSKQV